MNSKIIKELKKLITLRHIQGANKYTILANQRAIEAIETLQYEIKSGEEARNKINGIGMGIAKHIDDILNNGSIEEIDNLHPDVKDKVNKITKLMDIQGIGYTKALKYFEEGREGETNREKIFEKYKNELQERIPREYITKYKEKFRKIISSIHPDIFFKFVGSYRREIPNSGDIDVLLYFEHIDEYKDTIIEMLDLKGQFSSGKEKFEGIIYLNDDFPAVKIDLMFINDINEYPYALLYFTGNKMLNIKMRSKARKLGLKLTNTNMTDEYGEKIIVENEKEIFQILDIPYLKPRERNL